MDKPRKQDTLRATEHYVLVFKIQRRSLVLGFVIQMGSSVFCLLRFKGGLGLIVFEIQRGS